MMAYYDYHEIPRKDSDYGGVDGLVYSAVHVVVADCVDATTAALDCAHVHVHGNAVDCDYADAAAVPLDCDYADAAAVPLDCAHVHVRVHIHGFAVDCDCVDAAAVAWD
jgi:hypothetical protein